MKITRKWLENKKLNKDLINRYEKLTNFADIPVRRLMKLLYDKDQYTMLFCIFHGMKTINKKESINCSITSNDLLFHQGSLTVNGTLRAKVVMIKGNLIINDKSYSDSCLEGNIVEVGGDIKCNHTINTCGDLSAGGDIICDGQINAHSRINSGRDIISKYCITAGQQIKANRNIMAGTQISSFSGSIYAGNEIKAERFIEAGFMIKCKKIITNNHGIYIGKFFQISRRNKAVLIAEEKPENLLSGQFKHISEPLTMLEKDLFR